MIARFVTSIAFVLLIAAGASAAGDDTASLSATEIMLKVDSVTTYQDSLFSRTKYQVRVEAYFDELDDKGRVKNSDTTISLATMMGKEELSDSLIYSTKRPESKKGEQKGEMSFSLSPDNPDYSFLLTDSSDSSYIITVSPTASPPKKGDVKGTIAVDRVGFFTRNIDFEVPRPEGALKELTTKMTFEPLEGGLVVMKDVTMKGYVKAFLGIFKMRFKGQVRYTDYQILD